MQLWITLTTINSITSIQSLNNIFTTTKKKILKVNLIDNQSSIAIINTLQYFNNITDVIMYMAPDSNSPLDQFLFTHFRNPFLNLTNIAYDVSPVGTQQLYDLQ